MPAAERAPSTKEQLHNLFAEKGTRMKKEDLFAKLPSIKPATTVTMIADLKKPRYYGPADPIETKANDGHFVRVS